jgi:hypothetical protein
MFPFFSAPGQARHPRKSTEAISTRFPLIYMPQSQSLRPGTPQEHLELTERAFCSGRSCC